MINYRDLGGDSGVVAYETGSDFIRVEFEDGGIYLSPTKAQEERMSHE